MRRPSDDTGFVTELPASLTSARRARTEVRRILAVWGMEHLAGDAELLASELVANAAEHGSDQPITLALRRYDEPGRQPGLLCEVTDASPQQPRTAPVPADAERGRGLAIVSALATDSGVTRNSPGKTAWFSLSPPAPTATTPQWPAEVEAEAGA